MGRARGAGWCPQRGGTLPTCPRSSKSEASSLSSPAGVTPPTSPGTRHRGQDDSRVLPWTLEPCVTSNGPRTACATPGLPAPLARPPILSHRPEIPEPLALPPHPCTRCITCWARPVRSASATLDRTTAIPCRDPASSPYPLWTPRSDVYPSTQPGCLLPPSPSFLPCLHPSALPLLSG